MTDKGKVLLSKPKDESLAAFKSWIGEMYHHLTGDDISKAKTPMTEERWKQEHEKYWSKRRAAQSNAG